MQNKNLLFVVWRMPNKTIINMAVTNFNKLPLEKQLLVIKRYKQGSTIKEKVDLLTLDNPIISVWRNGKIKIYS